MSGGGGHSSGATLGKGRGIWRYLIRSMDRIFFLMIEFHKYACSNLVAISEEVKDLDQAPA